MKRLLIALTYFLLSFALFAYSESGGNRYLNLQDEGGITHSHPKEVKEAFPWNETQNQEGSAPYYDDVAIQNAFAAVSYDTATFCAGNYIYLWRFYIYNSRTKGGYIYYSRRGR